MDFANYWFSGFGGEDPGPGPGPGPDPGDPIGQSLRFRFPSNQLQRSITTAGDNTTWTFSSWVKHASVDGNRQRMIIDGGDQVGTAGTSDFSFSPSDNLIYNNYQNGVKSNITSVAVFRDPSAWYHIVLVHDSTNATASERIRLYVNGQRQTISTSNWPAQDEASFMMIAGQTMQLGGRTNSTTFDMDDYQASVYFIDGQVLEPTAFGNYNDNGVWVPREVDFTPATMRYSDYLTVSGGTQYGASSLAFNGDIDPTSSGSGTVYTDVGESLTWAPEPAVPFTTSLEIYNQMAPSQGDISWDGNVVDPTTGWVTVFSGSGEVSANKPLVIQGTGARAYLNAVRIDGELVNDPFLYSADLAGGTENTYQANAADRTGNITDGTNAFDGNLSSSAYNNVQSDFLYFKPTTPLTGITSLFYRTAGTIEETRVNGNTVTTTSTGTGTRWVEIDNPPATLNELAFTCSDGFSQLVAVGINGTDAENILVDGVNSSYGANGFHLDFSDPNDIGADRSGNGNDFTATGFDTAPVGIFNDDFFTETGNTSLTPNWNSTQKNFLASYGPERALNGNTSNNDCVAPQGSGWVFFRREFSGVTSLKVYGNLDAIGVNDTVVMSNIVSTPPYDLTSFIPADGTITSLACMKAGQFGFSAIEINGTILVNNTGEDYDLMLDSPTQNYATLNPLDPFASATIDANLGITAGAAREFAPGTIAMADNRFYVELNCDQPPVNPPNRQYIVYIVPSSGMDNSTPSASTGAYEVKINSGTNFTVGTNGSPVVTGTLSSAPGANFTMQVLYNAGTRGLYCSIDNANWLRNDGTISTAFDESEPTIVLPEPASGSYTIGCNIYNGTGNINYGQQPFLYTPPAGFEALQTQSLPAAPIADGRDHFQAITGPGQGADNGVAGQLAGNWSKDITIGDGNSWYNMSAAAIFDGTNTTTAGVTHPASGGTNGQFSFIYWNPEGGLDFTDTVEVWSNNSTPSSFTFNGGPQQTVAAGQWVEIASGGGTINNITCGNQLPNNSVAWWSGIRVDGNVLVDASILAIAQQTFPNGLWWVKNRASASQHQLVDSVRGGNLAMTTPSTGSESTYSTPVGDCVAWCWKAGSTAVTNNDGSIESQVSANTLAGFSIVTYTGNSTTGATVGHGLGETPDMIIVKGRNYTDEWHVKHVDIGNDSDSLRLNSNAPAADFNAWNNTAPDSSVFTLGPINGTNKSAAPLIAYCWHSVPGYSAFGSYTGGGTSFPFIFTGFRPAFVLIKLATGSGNWTLHDSAREPYNPANTELIPNSAGTEGLNSFTQIDMLSNGFKIRGEGGATNQSGQTLVYAAFAENPFQAPATAR